VDSDTSKVDFTVTKSALCLELISHTTEKKSDAIYCTVAEENDLGYGHSNELKKMIIVFREE